MPAKANPSVSKALVVYPVKKLPVNSYSSLVKAVRQELQELDFFITRRTALGYWRVGEFIHEHLLEHRIRAEHNTGFFEQLARDAGRDSSTLQKMVRFYRAYPNLARGPDLTWSHYRVLMGVKDKEQRHKLEKEIVRKNWDAQQLQEHLRTRREHETAPDDEKPVLQLNVTRGHLNIYKVLATELLPGGKPTLLIDYGFGVRRVFPTGEGKGFKDGDLLERSGGRYVKTDVEDKLRYTYKAYVERVVDGDTLLVLIEGGGGNLVEERLRLRGIDCPELKTEAGQRAKRFVESKLKGLPFIVIRTYKEQVDIHARYLTDVFYLPGETDEAAVASQGNFLNQELLDERLAVMYP